MWAVADFAFLPPHSKKKTFRYSCGWQASQLILETKMISTKKNKRAKASVVSKRVREMPRHCFRRRTLAWPKLLLSVQGWDGWALPCDATCSSVFAFGAGLSPYVWLTGEGCCFRCRSLSYRSARITWSSARFFGTAVQPFTKKVQLRIVGVLKRDSIVASWWWSEFGEIVCSAPQCLGNLRP